MGHVMMDIKEQVYVSASPGGLGNDVTQSKVSVDGLRV